MESYFGFVAIYKVSNYNEIPGLFFNRNSYSSFLAQKLNLKFKTNNSKSVDLLFLWLARTVYLKKVVTLDL